MEELSALANVSIVPMPTVQEPGPLAPQFVRIIENWNPFRLEQRRTFDLAPLENESVGAIVVRAHFVPEDYAISINGEPLAAADVWRTAIKPGQQIVLFTRAAGAGFGKSLLDIVIVIAVAFAAAATAGVALVGMAMMGAVMSTAVMGSIIIGAGVAGAAVMAWALAPGAPTAPAWSTTYDPTGPKGLAQPGVPIPKGYSAFGWCGNIISSFVDFDGSDAYIYALASYGWGTALSVNNPLLNGKPISEYANCNYQVRLGTNTQTPIAGFNRIANGYPQETQMTVALGAVTVPGTGTDVQGLQITCKLPSGLYRITGDGNTVPLKVIYKIEYAAHNSGNWISPLMPNVEQQIYTVDLNGDAVYPGWVVVPTDRFAGSGIVYAWDSGSHTPGDPWTSTETVDVVDMDGNVSTTTATFQGQWQPCDPQLGQVGITTWWQGFRVLNTCNISPFFDTISIYGLTPGQYDVRVTKIGFEQDNLSGDIQFADSPDAQHVCDIWLWNVNEITLADLAYPNMILVGVQALATSQMSGANLQILCDIVHDIGADTVLPTALAGFEHDNPAVVAYDVLANPVYGMGVAAANIDVPAFVAWAEFCDELVTNQDGSTARRFVFSGIFDQASDAWKTLQTIGNMSRAQVTPMGMQYTVVIDAPADPVQLFTVGNTNKDSFQEMWLALDDRCTLIECDFADAARSYRMDLPVSVMTVEDLNSGLQPKIMRTKLIGCTDRDQAWRWAYYQLMSTKLTLRTVQITAPIEAVVCKRGSVIAVQSDVTQWAVGGRVQPGSTLSTVNVDRTDITFAPGAGWTVSVQQPVVERGTGTINSISGVTLTMTAALPAGRILKIVGPDGTEYIVTGSGGSQITVETLTPQSATTPLAAGQTVTLYDLNVLDVLDVNAVAITANGATITVAGDFSAVPTPDSSWAYGQSAGAQPAKLFRVVSIAKSGDFSFKIGALEYNAAAYVDPVPNYGEVIGVPDSAPSILNLSLTEQYQNGTATGSANSSIVAVGWQNANTAVGALITVQAANGTAQTLGKIQGTGCTFVGVAGTEYTVTATGFDWAGNVLGSPVSASITVVAASSAPGNVSGFSGTAGTANIVLSWNAIIPAPDHYEIRWAQQPNTDWENAAVLWDGTGNTWTDTTLRSGYYMIVAVSSLATGSVESVTPAIWASTLTVVNPVTGGPNTSITMPVLTTLGGGTDIIASGLAGTINGTAITPGQTLDIGSLSSFTTSGTYYTFLYLSSSLVLASTGNNPWVSGSPDSSKCAAQIAAGDVILLAVWNISVDADSGAASFGGGSVTLYSGGA